MKKSSLHSFIGCEIFSDKCYAQGSMNHKFVNQKSEGKLDQHGAVMQMMIGVIYKPCEHGWGHGEGGRVARFHIKHHYH